MGDSEERLEQEAEVIRLSLDGQPDRFRDLVTRYQAPVLTLCLRMVGSFADAEDLTQQTFMDAFRKLGSFDRGRPFVSWLFRIAVNNCKDFLKSRKRSEHPTEIHGIAADEVLFGAPMGDPEQDLARRRESERLTRALFALPLKYREVLVLKDVQGLSYREIREILELPITTLKIRVVRARARMIDLLGAKNDDA